ncbi:MAG: PaREP1/PaREP8 domain-containing protein [Chloroflexota bacterium]|nr:PaREP1/PaREP8 domain-containing protein [Chloroflexota bacterium]
MLTHEHVHTAQEFLEKAEAEFEAGDILQGSEKLWGAATHAIMANAQLRGWNFGSHRAMGEAVDRLAEEYADESLEPGFAVAEKCHANYYHDFMEDYELTRARAIVPRFVNRLLALLPRENGA